MSPCLPVGDDHKIPMIYLQWPDGIEEMIILQVGSSGGVVVIEPDRRVTPLARRHAALPPCCGFPPCCGSVLLFVLLFIPPLLFRGMEIRIFTPT